MTPLRNYTKRKSQHINKKSKDGRYSQKEQDLPKAKGVSWDWC